MEDANFPPSFFLPTESTDYDESIQELIRTVKENIRSTFSAEHIETALSSLGIPFLTGMNFDQDFQFIKKRKACTFV